jgi:hypothetical protein
MGSQEVAHRLAWEVFVYRTEGNLSQLFNGCLGLNLLELKILLSCEFRRPDDARFPFS